MLLVIKTLDLKCLLRLVFIILAEISAHHSMQLKCMGGHCFSVPSQVLSDSHEALHDYTVAQ